MNASEEVYGYRRITVVPRTFWYRVCWQEGNAEHVCDLMHDCQTTTVNHRCHCGAEMPPREEPPCA